MGPLPHATNGHGLHKHFSHCTIPSPHQNTSSHSVANPVETLQVPPTFHFVHCTFENKIGSKNFRIVHIPDELRKINTSAIFMYIICHLNFILWFWIWFMISIFGISYGNSRIYFTIQIILWYFWIWFLWYFIFTFMWNFTIRMPCLGSGRAFYLIRN